MDEQDRADPLFVRMYEWRSDEYIHSRVAGELSLVIDGDQSWFALPLIVEGQEWGAVYNERTLQWDSLEVGPESLEIDTAVPKAFLHIRVGLNEFTDADIRDWAKGLIHNALWPRWVETEIIERLSQIIVECLFV